MENKEMAQQLWSVSEELTKPYLKNTIVVDER